MRFEPPKIEISPSAPWRRSAFNLEETGTRLSRLVKQIEGPAVISLNAPWGTGKTTFLDMWSHHLKNDGAKVIKFSAWEVDHTDEPLIAIIQELSGQLELGNQSERLEKIKQSTTKLLKQVSPTVLRLLTSGVVNIDGMGDLAEEVVKAKLESHENAKSSAENFRKQLEELAQHVKDENAHYPLILIIDELDRCRPTYAVETLEVIKHFFNVDNVVFVLGVDASQLTEAIKGHYGSGYDGQRYLRKFFHLQLELPKPNLRKFCRHTLDRLGIKEVFEDTGDPSRSPTIAFVSNLTGAYTLSLRDVERLLLETGVIYESTGDFPPIFASLVLWLLVQKQEEPVLFSRFMQKNITVAEVWDKIEPFRSKLFFNTDELEFQFYASLTRILDGRMGVRKLSDSALEKLNQEDTVGRESERWTQIQSWAQRLEQDTYNDYFQMLAESIAILGHQIQR